MQKKNALGILMAVLALLLVFGILYLVDAIYGTEVWWWNPFVLNRYLMGCSFTSPAFVVVIPPSTGLGLYFENCPS
jgi:hypothetical protein